MENQAGRTHISTTVVRWKSRSGKEVSCVDDISLAGVAATEGARV